MIYVKLIKYIVLKNTPPFAAVLRPLLTTALTSVLSWKTPPLLVHYYKL